MAQLDGSDIVYVARVAVPKIISLRVEIGTRFPALQTSQGKVLLAALDAEALAARAGRAEPVGPAAVPAARPTDMVEPSCARSGRAAGRWPTRSWRRASGRSPRRCATGRGRCARP